MHTSCCKVILPILFFFSFQISTHAQIGGHINVGTIVGGPIALPIPEGGEGAPGWGINIGTEVSYTFFEKLSIHSGVFYSAKKATYASPIEGKYDISNGVLGIKLPFPLDVKYTGDVEGTVNNTYLDVPLYFNYQTGKKVAVGLGFQYSKLLEGGMTGTADIKAALLKINDQEFDESHLVRKNEKALLGEFNIQVVEKLNIKLRATYALTKLLTEELTGSENPRNIYMGIMVGYQVF